MGISGGISVIRNGLLWKHWQWPARLTDQHAVGITFVLLLAINAMVFSVSSGMQGKWVDCVWDALIVPMAFVYVVWVTRGFKDPYKLWRPIALWVTLTLVFSIGYNVAYARWDAHKTASYEVCGLERPDGTTQCCGVRLREYEMLDESVDMDSNLKCRPSYWPIFPMMHTYWDHPEWLWKWPPDQEVKDVPMVITSESATEPKPDLKPELKSEPQI